VIAATEQSRAKVHMIRMTPQFTLRFEEAWTASETGRWFLCCPHWWQGCFSRSSAKALWHAGV